MSVLKTNHSTTYFKIKSFKSQIKLNMKHEYNTLKFKINLFRICKQNQIKQNIGYIVYCEVHIVLKKIWKYLKVL